MAIGVSKTAVSKELKRNRCTSGHYSPKMTQMFTDDAKQRSHKPSKLDVIMEAFIREKMERWQWSPEQIKGCCDTNVIEMVSVEWIYHLVRKNKHNDGTFHRRCRYSLKHRKRCVGAGMGTSPTGCPYTRDPKAQKARRSSQGTSGCRGLSTLLSNSQTILLWAEGNRGKH